MALPKPLRDYILAKIVVTETKTKSGIILPESATEKSEDAVVKAVGRDVKDVKVGDTITYKTYNAVDKEAGNEKYVLVKEEDVAGVS